jgi:hypothetical protein
MVYIHGNRRIGNYLTVLYSNLKFLCDIETLGRSVGYQEHLKLLHMISNFTHVTTLTSDSYTNQVWVMDEVLSFFIYSTLKITMSEYTGKGHA